MSKRQTPQANQWRKDNKIRYLVLKANARAKKKGLEGNITKKDIEDLIIKQDNCCAYSGISFDSKPKEKSKKNFVAMSIDRIDSSRGYTIDNIQLVCVAANLMKNELSEYQFLWIVRKIAKKTDKKYKGMIP